MGAFQTLLGHQEQRGKIGDEWFTPPEVIKSLGAFDLDPACGDLCPNKTARRRYAFDGLTRPWKGRVWLNPPFSGVAPWAARMVEHGNGIMLAFGRTDAKWFQQTVDAAGCVFLFRNRMGFTRPGEPNRRTCPIGCVLFPFGPQNREAILAAGFNGIMLDAVRR